MNVKSFAAFVAVLLALSSRTQAQTTSQNIPGTPGAGFNNPGGKTIVIQEGGGVGVQPITTASSPDPFNVVAGDIVFLQDPAAGDAPSNWAAVLQFFNPDDPSGILDLEGTRYETFFPNNTPGGFANLALFPNTVYLPQSGAPQNGTLTAMDVEFGPANGQILVGQTALFVFSAAPQPDLVPEPGTLGCLGAGALFLGAILRQRKRLRCPFPALPVD